MRVAAAHSVSHVHIMTVPAMLPLLPGAMGVGFVDLGLAALVDRDADAAEPTVDGNAAVVRQVLAAEQRQRDAGELVEDHAVVHARRCPAEAVLEERARPRQIVDAEGEQADALFHAASLKVRLALLCPSAYI